MSWTCDKCREKFGMEHGLGWPFMGISYGRCEDCGKTSECENLHEYRRLTVKEKKNLKTKEVK